MLLSSSLDTERRVATGSLFLQFSVYKFLITMGSLSPYSITAERGALAVAASYAAESTPAWIRNFFSPSNKFSPVGLNAAILYIYVLHIFFFFKI